MAEDSQKILKELSNLSSNLDVLSRELRQNNKLLFDQNQAQTKNLEDKPGEKQEERKEVSKQPFDQKFFENFSKSLAENFQKQQGNVTNTITQTLGKELSGILQKKENKPAEVKPLPPNEKEINPINFLLNSLKSLPKMQDGGKVTSTGSAIVGERGPEVVNLVQGSKVTPAPKAKKPLDPEAKKKREKELIELYFLGMSEEQVNREKALLLASGADLSGIKFPEFKQKETSSTESGGTSAVTKSSLSSIESSIQKNEPPPVKDERFKDFKNAWGVQIPMDELNRVRKELYQDDPEYFSDESILNSETLGHFKYNKNYPQYLPKDMSPEDIEVVKQQAMDNDPELITPNTIAKLSTPFNSNLEAKTDIQESSLKSLENREKKGSNETVEGSIGKNKTEKKKFSETKFGQGVTNSAKLVGEIGKEFISNKFKSATGISPLFLKEKVKQFQGKQQNQGTSEISKEQQQLKTRDRTQVENKENPSSAKTASPVPQVQNVQSEIPSRVETKTAPVPNQSTQVQTRATGNASQEPLDLTKDMKELKGLLAGIYNSLQSHLDISNNMPYRPNSNII